MVRSGKVKAAAAALALSLLVAATAGGEARGAEGWSWPVEGAVITSFSNDPARPYAGGMHRGIDVAAGAGTAVRAARAGEVTYAGALGYAGLTVAVRTVDGYVTSYLHLSSVGVRRGQSLAGGARIGAVGTTGRRSTSRAHLHFGVRVAGTGRRYVDPLSLLPRLPGANAGGALAPAPAPAQARPRAAPAPARVPLPVPLHRRVPAAAFPGARAPAPAVHHPHLRPVPVAPAPKRIAHRAGARRAGAPVLAPAPRASEPVPDVGRPLALGGLALLALALFGRSAVKAARDANGAVSGRIHGALVRAFGALREIGHAPLRRALQREYSGRNP